MTHSVLSIQASSARALCIYLLMHLPLGLLLCYASPKHLPLDYGLIALLSALPLLLRAAGVANAVLHGVIALCSMLLVAYGVYLLEGHPWQIDMHMYFFAMLAILTALLDKRVIIIATLVVAAHHLLFNLAYPLAVFPEGEQGFLRVLMHAVILLLEAGAVFYMIHLVTDSLQQAEYSLQKAEMAQAQMTESEHEKARLREQSEMERLAFQKHFAQRFEEDVKELIVAVSESAHHLAKMAGEMSTQIARTTKLTNESRSRANDVLTQVESTAAATEQLSASIREIAVLANRSNQLVEHTVGRSEDAGESAGSLEKAARDVREIIDVISKISSQINLLALNATIESARAGEAGRGFAVVASEVKNLAGQTEHSIGQIGETIQGVNRASDIIRELLNDIRLSVEEVSGSAAGIAGATEQQSAATNEIASGMQSANRSVQAIVSDISEVDGLSRQCTDLSNDLLLGTKNLEMQTAKLRDRLDSFVRTLKEDHLAA